MLVVEVYVNGKAREKNGAGVEFDAKVLRNGTDLKFESLDFQMVMIYIYILNHP